MKAQVYAVDFDRIYKEFLGPIYCTIYSTVLGTFFCSVYQSTVRDVQLCAALIYWNVVTTLEVAYFLTRWLLPWGRLEWNNMKQMLASTRLPQPYAAHRGVDDEGAISCAQLQIPTLDFDQDFPIMTQRGEGSEMGIHYNLQVHGDLLLYAQAFMEVPETKPQDPIHQMDPDQYWLWDQYYLF